jgi:uncharacterized protein YndB with AHSA1/START domain
MKPPGLPSLTIVRRIKAPPARVYAAFTTPEQVALWFGPDAGPVLAAELDVRVGGRLRVVFETEDGVRHEVRGVYREITPGARLVYTHGWVSLPEQESLVTVTFAAIAEGCELTVLHEQLPDDRIRDLHVEGWIGTIDKLQALVEAAAPTAP